MGGDDRRGRPRLEGGPEAGGAAGMRGGCGARRRAFRAGRAGVRGELGRCAMAVAVTARLPVAVLFSVGLGEWQLSPEPPRGLGSAGASAAPGAESRVDGRCPRRLDLGFRARGQGAENHSPRGPCHFISKAPLGGQKETRTVGARIVLRNQRDGTPPGHPRPAIAATWKCTPQPHPALLRMSVPFFLTLKGLSYFWGLGRYLRRELELDCLPSL